MLSKLKFVIFCIKSSAFDVDDDTFDEVAADIAEETQTNVYVVKLLMHIFV